MKKSIINYGIIVFLVISIFFIIYLENVSKTTIDNVEKPDEVVGEKHSYSIDIPYNWEECVDEKNSINAIIDIPDVIRTKGFQRAVGTVKEVVQEDILDIVQYYEPVYDNEDEYSVMYSGKDNMFFSFQKKVGSAYLMTDSYIYIRMAYRDGLSDDYNRDLYMVDIDLENFSIKECDKKLKDIFNKFGMNGDINIIHRALDYKIMDQEALELSMDGTETKPDYKWNESDNCFHCTFSQACNEISILPSWRFKTAGDILNAGAHTLVLNKERVVGFDIDDVYEIEYQQEYETLLEFTEILQIYRESTKLFTNNHNKEIKEISLRVIPVPIIENQYQMIPVWIFYGYWFDEKRTFEAPFAVMINAVTGDEL